jgi:hypothetical protein
VLSKTEWRYFGVWEVKPGAGRRVGTKETEEELRNWMDGLCFNCVFLDEVREGACVCDVAKSGDEGTALTETGYLVCFLACRRS